MNDTLVISANGVSARVISFGPGQMGAACIQASVDAAIGAGRVTVGTSLPSTVTLTSRGVPSWRRTEDSPTARRFHATGCRWRTGKDGERRGWECADDCQVPALIEQEAAEDD